MTIGLFGTCGGSTWRDGFMEKYDEMGIGCFNPLKDDWKPEDAQIEAEHLANDEIILFPVTDETSGLGSLGEVGFSILQAIKLDADRAVIVMIDKDCKIEDEAVKKESIRTRALIKAHLNKLKYPNVYIVDNLENMMIVSLQLHKIHKVKELIAEYTV
jgi:hypothetical protein